MSRSPVLAAAFLVGMSVSFTLGTPRAAAQGPAGAGSAAVAQESSHSMNPMKWIKKDSTTPDVANRTDLESKLTPSLRAAGVLPSGVTVTSACSSFTTLDECLAVLHASHNLNLDFYCLRADATGVHTNVDLSACKAADGDKPQGFVKAIHQLKPDANAKRAAKDAEDQARDDLNSIVR
jgi:hypothetical protein